MRNNAPQVRRAALSLPGGINAIAAKGAHTTTKSHAAQTSVTVSGCRDQRGPLRPNPTSSAVVVSVPKSTKTTSHASTKAKT